MRAGRIFPASRRPPLGFPYGPVFTHLEEGCVLGDVGRRQRQPELGEGTPAELTPPRVGEANEPVESLLRAGLRGERLKVLLYALLEGGPPFRLRQTPAVQELLLRALRR